MLPSEFQALAKKIDTGLEQHLWAFLKSNLNAIVFCEKNLTHTSELHDVGRAFPAINGALIYLDFYEFQSDAHVLFTMLRLLSHEEYHNWEAWNVQTRNPGLESAVLINERNAFCFEARVAISLLKYFKATNNLNDNDRNSMVRSISQTLRAILAANLHLGLENRFSTDLYFKLTQSDQLHTYPTELRGGNLSTPKNRELLDKIIRNLLIV